MDSENDDKVKQMSFVPKVVDDNVGLLASKDLSGGKKVERG